MCQARPGPRCSAHMRAARQHAADVVESAFVVYSSAVADLAVARTRPGPDLDATQAAMEQAQHVALGAEHDYQAAQHAYNATPEGMRMLQGQSAYLIEQGNAKGAALKDAQLLTARANRADQVEALRVSRAHRDLTHNLTPAQTVTLASLNAAAKAAEGDHVQALSNLRDADRNLNEHTPILAAAEADHDKQSRASDVEPREEALRAQVAVQDEAARVYREHGFSDARAHAMTVKMVEESVRGRTASSNERWRHRDLSVPVLANANVWMYSAPSIHGSRRAVEASKTDPGYQAALTTFRAAHAHRNAAAAVLRSHPFHQATSTHRALTREAEQARWRTEDAGRAAVAARDDAHRAYAEIADLPASTAYRYNMRLRAYTLPQDTEGRHIRPYEAPSPGLPNGRIMPPLSTNNQSEAS